MDKNDKLGRNDLCPCGSGKKYKKCCLKEVSPEITEIAKIDKSWYQLRKTEGIVIDKHLLLYISKELPLENMLESALSEFFPDDFPEELDREVFFDVFFIPWFLFNWEPLFDIDVDQFDSEKTIAINYLNKYGQNLNDIEKRFIEAMNKTYYSFYSILEVDLGRSLVVKDILLGTTHTVKEIKATNYFERGDVIFGRLLTLDEQSIFIGIAPSIIPVDYHVYLIDLKEELGERCGIGNLDDEKLKDFDFELRSYFFSIMQSVCNQPKPILINTDGDPMQISKSLFRINIDPKKALERLLPLTLSDDPEEFLEDAKYDESGTVKLLKFPWLKKGNKKHKCWDNTVMGQITIEDGLLTLETNSSKRAQKGKNLLTKYLGKDITFQETLGETFTEESMPFLEGEDEEQSQDFLKTPEFQGKVNQMATEHWKNWFDQRIPVLKNKTPREAARTVEGRERLEALLMQYEYYQEDGNLLKPNIDYLRKELGLN